MDQKAFFWGVLTVVVGLIIFGFIKHHFSMRPMHHKGHNHYDEEDHYDDDFDPEQHATYDPTLS